MFLALHVFGYVAMQESNFHYRVYNAQNPMISPVFDLNLNTPEIS